MRNLYFLAVLSILAGCASAGEPIAIGKDSYLVSAEGGGVVAPGKIQEAALQKAQAFCTKMGKRMMVSSVSPSWRTSIINFNCVDEADLKPVNLKPQPNIRIENTVVPAQ